MLTLAMPQSLPAAPHEALGLAQVGGEDARRQALRHAVVEGDGLVEVVVGERVQDRRERLGADDVGLRRHRDDRRTGVERVGGFVGQGALAAGDDLAAVVAGGGRARPASGRRTRRRSAGRRACPRRAGRRSAARRRPGRCARRARRGSNDARSGAAATCTAGRRCPRPRRRCRAAPGRGRRMARRSPRCCRPARGSSGRSDRRRPARPGAPSPSSRWPTRSAPPSWATSAAPTSAPPSSTWLRWSGAPVSAAARSNNALQASAVSGVLSLGFQITGLPHTSASAAFHDHTATGKLKARDDADRPHRVPRLHQPVAGSLAGDREAVQLARETDREVADVDHLLDLAEALGADLAGLDRHQLAELVLVLAEELTEPPHASHRAPGRVSRATSRMRSPPCRRRRRRRRPSRPGRATRR